MLTRWEPFGSLRRRSDFFGDLTTIQQEMNRLFDEFFGERRAGLSEGQWIPVIDVSEIDSQLLVRAELPGMTQDDIEVNLEDNVLTIKGEKKQEVRQEKEHFHCVERTFGGFSRSFTLPAGVKADEIKASFEDGILTVVLPKSEEAKPKKIAITPGS